MTHLKAIIIDDEPLAHKVILEYAKSLPFLEIVGQCHLAIDAFAMLQEKQVDLIFLDIQMPKLKGLDFLRVLPQKPLVIITSAYEEYALESYELEVCDYLLKPFRFERFLKAITRAQNQLQRSTTPESTVSGTDPVPILFIKVDKRMVQVQLAEIEYLESFGNYVKVWIGDQFHLTPRTLSSFESELPDQQFFRIHKSFVLNRQFIDYLEGNMVVLKNGKRLPIGKSQRAEFKRKLL